MTSALWQRSAVEIATLVRQKDVSCAEVTASVVARIAEVNPYLNAIVDVMADEAAAAASEADRAVAGGAALGPLHGVPVTIKVNIDTAGRATTDGVVAAKDNVAPADSPLVAHLRRAGAVIVGRTNTPAFSLRWFTDNDLHGRTLNPFDSQVTPGGSSGGAAVAVATGMGAIAHGNDYGGSVRYPAWACGVVGLRATAGRIAAHKATAPNRTISNQMMSVQGPLTRTVADARLALAVMAQTSSLDPNWVPAPLEYADTDRPHKVAVFKRHAAYDADPSVVAAIEQAAQWLAAAGYEIEEAEPPHFEEGAELWRNLVLDDLRRLGRPTAQKLGDAGLRANLEFMYAGRAEFDRDGYLDALMRRHAIGAAWSQFLERYPVLLMPVSWERPFAIDDDTRSAERLNRIVAAQSPLLGTAMMGLPGLAVPTGMSGSLPAGVQLVAWRFREDRLLRAGEAIERAAGFSALACLTSGN
jgi:amidase